MQECHLAEPAPDQSPFRILVIDDNPAFHEHFRDILTPGSARTSSEIQSSRASRAGFLLDSASQGQEGLALIQQAVAEGRRYCVAFVDLRMPPGWDGIETATRLWEADPDLQVVLCTAFSDVSWNQVSDRFSAADSLVILKKPFESIEVLQLAHALANKWLLAQQVHRRLADMDELVRERTEALRQSEANYRFLVEGSPDAILVHQEELFVYANAAAHRLLGLGGSGLVGRSIWEIVPAENQARIRARVSQVSAEGLVAPFLEQEIMVLGGGVVQVEAASIPFTYHGRPAVQTIMRDIRERKRGEEELRRSQAYFRALTEKAMDVITLLDREGTIRYQTPSVESVLGYGPNELLGRNAFELVHPEDRSRILGIFTAGIKQPDLSATEQLRFLHKNGSWRVLEIVARNLIHDPNVQGVVVNGRDVTERRQLEAELRQAQKMEAIGQLAGGVAHDFNNVLTAIRGNAELVAMGAGALSPAARDCLQQVVAGTARGANLTRQLLAFSRRQTIQVQPISLNDVVLNLTKMLHRILGETVQLECSFQSPLPAVQADVGLIEQVLVNFAVNARDAMPQGGFLRITTERVLVDEHRQKTCAEARPGEFVCVTVRDTGTGIAPEHLPRIFEPFFTTKAPDRGTGLGLATAYGIVKQHGGWMEVASQLGEGSTLRFFLPAVHSPATTLVEHFPDKARPVGRETILLAEDEDTVRSITKRVLEQFGYQVVETASGREALQLEDSKLGEIDLLLTDVVMPGGINGRELGERMLARRPDLKVILMSGYSGDLLEAGLGPNLPAQTRLLQKPCRVDELLRTIRECLDESDLTASPPGIRPFPAPCSPRPSGSPA